MSIRASTRPRITSAMAPAAGRTQALLENVHYDGALAGSEVQQNLAGSRQSSDALIGHAGQRSSRVDPGFSQPFPQDAHGQFVLLCGEVQHDILGSDETVNSLARPACQPARWPETRAEL